MREPQAVYLRGDKRRLPSHGEVACHAAKTCRSGPRSGAEAEFLWTPAALDAWLAQPAAFLPGNRMAYAGLNDQSDRDAVIAALVKQTSDSQGTME
jgi:cytochrome c2